MWRFPLDLVNRALARDVAMGFSVANLFLLSVWARLGAGDQGSPAWQALLVVSALANVLLLGILFAAIFIIATFRPRSSTARIAGWIPVAVLLAAMNWLRQPSHVNWDSVARHPETTAVTIAVTVFAFIRWHRRVRALAAFTVLILTPLIPIAVLSATWNLSRGAVATRQSPPPVANRPPLTRVVWMIFDEMDQRVAFAARPATVALPAFDRLRAEAVVATSAFPPSTQQTVLSMPALTTGRLVEEAEDAGRDDLVIKFADAPNVASWSDQPTVFSRARERGFDTALVGWAIPYCRILGHTIRRCEWFPHVLNYEPFDLSLPGVVGYQLAIAASTVPFATRFVTRLDDGALRRRAHIGVYRRVLKSATSLVSDASLGLVLVHWPIPHQPEIYNRFRNDFTVRPDGTYLDNLVLADHALAEVRRVMEAAGVWATTHVLISADHSWRIPTRRVPIGGEPRVDPRVPFILKIAGRQAPVEYRREFNTVLTHDLILALLDGTITTASDAVRWLDARH